MLYTWHHVCALTYTSCTDHIYDVPSLPCRDIEIENNVAYATVLPETQWNEAYATTRRTDINVTIPRYKRFA
jgi:hypothetical protein